MATFACVNLVAKETFNLSMCASSDCVLLSRRSGNVSLCIGSCSSIGKQEKHQNYHETETHKLPCFKVSFSGSSEKIELSQRSIQHDTIQIAAEKVILPVDTQPFWNFEFGDSISRNS